MLRRKLVINLLIIVICGTVAVSIPVIINYCRKPVDASNQPTSNGKLVCEFVGNRYQQQTDSCAVWRLCLKQGETVVASWDEIFASISVHNPLEYDQKHLQLTAYGLCFRGICTNTDYQKLVALGYRSYIIYQGQTVLLQLS